MLVHGLPGVGLTKISFFLVSPWLLSLVLDFVSHVWLTLVCPGSLEPGALAPLHPGYGLRDNSPPLLQRSEYGL